LRDLPRPKHPAKRFKFLACRSEGNDAKIGQYLWPCIRFLCGHPDDPESGCGGTLARYAVLGASVTIIYLTRGEAGIPRKSHDEDAAIRSAECEASCRILGAKPVFAGQIDGATVVDNDAAESLRKLIFAEDPDVVFTHWPIDTHLDHQAASTLAYRAWLAARGRFEGEFPPLVLRCSSGLGSDRTEHGAAETYDKLAELLPSLIAA
jgi:LmbE family N-acetylglucosaminyl deacetylase